MSHREPVEGADAAGASPRSGDSQEEIIRQDTGLVWGVKESFLAYVSRWPGSSVSLAPGSGQLLDGRFYFAPDPLTPPGGFWFRGGFRLQAHGGLLDLSMADPRVEASGVHLHLTGETWNEGTWERLRFADLDWPADQRDKAAGLVDTGDSAVRTITVAARLHPDATALFDETYSAGEELAPLIIRSHQGSGPRST